MKIGLSTRSQEELLKLMELTGERSARHVVQMLITKALKSIPPS